MASVYKFKRKSEKIPEKADPKKNDETLNQLLFGENLESTPETPAEPVKKEKTEKRNIEEEESLYTSSEDKSSVPQGLLDALSGAKVDSEKIEEVFSHSKGTVGADSSEEEYDETADLLREI